MSQILKTLCLVLTVFFLASCTAGTDEANEQSSRTTPESHLDASGAAPSGIGENLPDQQVEPSSVPAPKPPVAQVKSTPEGWYDDYNAAMTAARQTNRPVFVLFTGSDWCGWCIKLREDVLSQPAFQKLASEELILMFVDSPRDFDLPPHIRQAHEMLAQTLGAGGGVPHAILVSADGKKIGEISGYRKEPDYLKELRGILSQK
jgi:protein disulfide-isomerase